MVRVFLSFKVGVKINNKNSKTPLSYAALDDNPEHVKLLINHGPDVNAINFIGSTLLHEQAVRESGGNYIEICNFLLNNGAGVIARQNLLSTEKSKQLLARIVVYF